MLMTIGPCNWLAELGLKKEVRELVTESEQPDLVQTVLLPEDQALRHLPALSLAHRRLDFTSHRASLSPLQEVLPSHRHPSLTLGLLLILLL